MGNPSKDSILIVEDEKNLGDTLSEYLASIGHRCFLADSCKRAKDLFYKYKPHVVLVDIGLPDGNGLNLAREFRKKEKDFVLLFLSAQNDPDIKVEGLETGADDYITKPFNLRELTLRLDRIRKNQNKILPDTIAHGRLAIYFNRFEVRCARGIIHSLSRKERGILKLLYLNCGKPVDRNTMIENVWGDGHYPSNRTVDNYIVKLRKWSETDPDRSIRITSVRGIGYKLMVR
ncbi:MAG: response regulator transcription factor [Halobacteriovoraceae bacterium]|nr:response regulator transcription factor [Halobacteriovoraceae bacterium]